MKTETAVTHTPGPWTVGRPDYAADGVAYVAARNEWSTVPREIAVIYRAEAQQENARLIAAAPDLLAALDTACEFLADRMDVLDGEDGHPRPDRFMSLFTELDAVRAKARGERWPR
jgi:hypothetical protein